MSLDSFSGSNPNKAKSKHQTPSGSSDSVEKHRLMLTRDFCSAALKFGPSFTEDQYRSCDEFVPPGRVQRELDMSFNEFKDSIGLSKNMERWSEGEIKSQIQRELDKHDEQLDSSFIDRHCDFSSSLVSSLYGSLEETLKELGFSVDHIDSGPDLSSKSMQSARSILSETDYDEEADGYVYIIKATLDNAGAYYYVGETTQSLLRRLYAHTSKHLQCKDYIEHDGDIKCVNDLDFDIVSMKVFNYYEDNLSKSDKLDSIITYNERKRYSQLCERVGHSAVVGGK